MKKLILYAFAFIATPLTFYGQNLTYNTTINSTSGANYAVNIQLELTSIVPVQNTCDWGYNYDVAYNYNIELVGSNAPSNLYTLGGYLTCGANQGIYFSYQLMVEVEIV